LPGHYPYSTSFTAGKCVYTRLTTWYNYTDYLVNYTFNTCCSINIQYTVNHTPLHETYGLWLCLPLTAMPGMLSTVTTCIISPGRYNWYLHDTVFHSHQWCGSCNLRLQM